MGSHKHDYPISDNVYYTGYWLILVMVNVNLISAHPFQKYTAY